MHMQSSCRHAAVMLDRPILQVPSTFCFKAITYQPARPCSKGIWCWSLVIGEESHGRSVTSREQLSAHQAHILLGSVLNCVPSPSTVCTAVPDSWDLLGGGRPDGFAVYRLRDWPMQHLSNPRTSARMGQTG